MIVQSYSIPDDLLYDRENHWIKVDNDVARIGLSQYGQSTIGDVLYVEPVMAGKTISKNDDAGSIESGKWVGRIVLPLSGTIIACNPEIQTNPGLLNTDPYGNGWLLELKMADKTELEILMDAKSYCSLVEKQVETEREEELVL